MLRLGECDVALAGGVSESIHTFGIFASFKSQGAWPAHDDPTKASRPFDVDRNGIVVAEGGCLYVLERLSRRQSPPARRSTASWPATAMNSDATDFVLPNPERQAECMNAALEAGRHRGRPDRHRQHARHRHRRGRRAGMHALCGESSANAAGHGSTTPRASSAMRWVPPGRLELAGNLPAFDDRRLPCYDQRRPARSRVRAARPGAESAARNRRRGLHSEQFVWHAGDQFGRDHQKTMNAPNYERTNGMRIAPCHEAHGVPPVGPVHEPYDLDS